MAKNPHLPRLQEYEGEIALLNQSMDEVIAGTAKPEDKIAAAKEILLAGTSIVHSLNPGLGSQRESDRTQFQQAIDATQGAMAGMVDLFLPTLEGSLIACDHGHASLAGAVEKFALHAIWSLGNATSVEPKKSAVIEQLGRIGAEAAVYNYSASSAEAWLDSAARLLPYATRGTQDRLHQIAETAKIHHSAERRLLQDLRDVYQRQVAARPGMAQPK